METKEGQVIPTVRDIISFINDKLVVKSNIYDNDVSLNVSIVNKNNETISSGVAVYDANASLGSLLGCYVFDLSSINLPVGLFDIKMQFNYLSLARSTKLPSRVSITILSSVLQKSGTFTSTPVSSVAGFVLFPEVSPLTPGSQ